VTRESHSILYDDDADCRGYAASYGLLQATLTGLTDQEMGVPALVSGAHQLYDGLRQLDSAYYGATNSDGSHSPGFMTRSL